MELIIVLEDFQCIIVKYFLTGALFFTVKENMIPLLRVQIWVLRM